MQSLELLDVKIVNLLVVSLVDKLKDSNRLGTVEPFILDALYFFLVSIQRPKHEVLDLHELCLIVYLSLEIGITIYVVLHNDLACLVGHTCDANIVRVINLEGVTHVLLDVFNVFILLPGIKRVFSAEYG